MIVSVVFAAVDLRFLAGGASGVQRAATWQQPANLTADGRRRREDAAIPPGYAFGIGPYSKPALGVWNGWPQEWLTSIPKQQCTIRDGVALEANGTRFQPKASRSYSFCREYLAIFVLNLRFQRVPAALATPELEAYLARLLSATATFRTKGAPKSMPLRAAHEGLAHLHLAAFPQKQSKKGFNDSLVIGLPPFVIVKDTARILSSFRTAPLTDSWKVGCAPLNLGDANARGRAAIVYPATALNAERDEKRRDLLYQNLSRMQSYLCAHYFEGLAMREMVQVDRMRKNFASRESDRERLGRFLARAATARRNMRKKLKSDTKLVERQFGGPDGWGLDDHFQAARQVIKAPGAPLQKFSRELLEAMR